MAALAVARISGLEVIHAFSSTWPPDTWPVVTTKLKRRSVGEKESKRQTNSILNLGRFWLKNSARVRRRMGPLAANG